MNSYLYGLNLPNNSKIEKNTTYHKTTLDFLER